MSFDNNGPAWRKTVPHAIAFGAVLVLAACSSFNSMWSGPPSLDWRGMYISADTRANMNSPVPLDVVFVMDQVLLDKLNSLPAAKWFDGRDEWVRTYPEQIQYRSYELVPGQNMNVTAEQFGVKHALAVLIYANYLDSGDHRARVDQYHKGMLVQLGPNELSVEARKDR